MRTDLMLIDARTNVEIVTLVNVPLLIDELGKPLRVGTPQGLPETLYHIKKVLEYDFTYSTDTEDIMVVKILVVAI